MVRFAVLTATLLLATPTAGSEATAEERPEPAYRGVSLGDYYIRDQRGAEGAKLRLSFTLYAQVEEAGHRDFVRRLERSKNRVRDVVHTGVRMANLKEFSEPGLERLRRRILLLLRRSLPYLKTDRLMFSQFEYFPD